MTIPAPVQEAMDRITSAEPDGYNNNVFNLSTNPLGFGSGGHRKNLFGTTNPLSTSLTNDVVTIAEWFNDQSDILDGYSVSAKKLAWYFTFSTTITDNDPGAGLFRLNNADPTLATYIYIDELNSDAVSAAAWIATFDDSTSTTNGELTIVSATNSAVQYKYRVTDDVVTATGYYKIPVAYIAGSGTLVNADQYGFNFAAKGDKGDTGTQGTQGIQGIQGDQGIQGIQGDQGVPAGYRYQFSTAIDLGDPTSGKVKFNNATPASISEVYISATDYVSNNLDAVITTWSASTSTVKGYLIAFDPAEPTKGVVLSVSGASDNGAWHTLSVAFVACATLPSNNAVLALVFCRTGDKGDTGSAGATGSPGPTGATGRMAGIPMVYDGSSYANGDPGTAKLRRNNATPALVDRLYISETDSDAKGVASWWSSASSGTSDKRGRIDIFHATDPTNFLSYDIRDDLTDNGGWDTLVVSYRDHGGTLSDTDQLLVHAFASGDKGDTGDTGAQGPAGAAGADGDDGAIGPTVTIEFLFDSTVSSSSDPGAGNLRFDSGTYGAVTQLSFDNQDANGSLASAWIDTFDETTNVSVKGLIFIRQVSNPAVWWAGKVTGAVVDGTGYRKVPVTYVAHSGTFTNTSRVSIEFSLAGDKGADGGGAGDVIGPASAGDGNFARFDTTTGKLIKDGGSFTAATIPNVAAGTISATNVQTALNELDTEKAPLASPAFTGTVDISQAHLFSGVISPTQITVDQDNYAPTGFSTCSVVRLTSDAARSITGLAGGSAGRNVLLLNVNASSNITLTHDATSTSANRFYCPNSVNFVLLPNASAWAWYDTTSSRWRIEPAGGNVQGIYAAAQGTLAAGTLYSQLGELDADVSGKANNGFVTFSGPTSSIKTFSLPNANETIGCLGQNNTWTGIQTFNDGKFVLAGGTSGALTLKATAIAGTTTITFPAVTDTVAVLGTAQTFTAAKTFQNSSGIKIQDTDASNTLGLVVGSNLSSDRTITLITGDASRTLTLNGDAILSNGTTMVVANNLSDVASVATAFVNLKTPLMHAACGGL